MAACWVREASVTTGQVHLEELKGCRPGRRQRGTGPERFSRALKNCSTSRRARRSSARIGFQRFDDRAVRLHCRRRSLVREQHDLLGVCCGESQAHRVRAHPRARRVRDGHGPGRAGPGRAGPGRDGDAALSLAQHGRNELRIAASGLDIDDGCGADRKPGLDRQVVVKRQPGTATPGQTGTVFSRGGPAASARTGTQWHQGARKPRPGGRLTGRPRGRGHQE